METPAECNDVLGLTYSFLHIYKNPIWFLLHRKPAPCWMHWMSRLEVNNFSRTWKCLLHNNFGAEWGCNGEEKCLCYRIADVHLEENCFHAIIHLWIWSDLCFCELSTAERVNENNSRARDKLCLL